MVVSYANFLTNTELSKITAAYRQILLIKKRTPTGRQISLKKRQAVHRHVTISQLWSCEGSTSILIHGGATNSCLETISKLLYEKALGIAIAIISVTTLCSVDYNQ